MNNNIFKSMICAKENVLLTKPEKVSKLFYVLWLCLFSLNIACNTIDKNDDVSDKVAFKIAGISITEYEFKKNLDRFRESFKQGNNAEPGKKDIEKWICEFTDQAYFLADAYQKGYNNKDVGEKVESMGHLIISQPNGLLEKELIKQKIIINNDEIELAKKRSTKKIHVEYLRFINYSYDSIVSFLGTDQLKNNEKFKETVDRCSKIKNILYQKTILTWPFTQLWEYQEYIFSLNKGDITPLLHFNDGYYIIYVNDIENLTHNNMQPDELEKQLILNLRLQKEQKFKIEFNNEILANIKMNFNFNTFGKIEKIIKDHRGFELDKAKFNGLLQLNIMSYTINGHDINVSVAEFIDFYNYLTMRQEITNMDQLVYYLRSMAFDRYMYEKAQKLGITEQKKFLLDKENYKKNLIYNLYELNELKTGTKATNEEIIERYNQNKNSFIQASNAVFTIISFDNNNNATSGKFYMDKIAVDSIKGKNLEGFKGISLHKEIEYESSNYPQQVKTAMFNLKINEVSMPIFFEGKFLVAKKESESGSRIKRVNEVWGTLMREIEKEKLQNNKEKRLNTLKKMYFIENKFDYQRYMQ